MIIRVFRAIVRDGMQSEFARFFRETAIPLLESQPGMLGLTVGWPVAHSPNEFMMTTTWSDLESLKGFAGDNWANAVIDPAEAHLLRETFVHHYEGHG
jgi:heme-degrading monooxygenase HmoA